MGYFLQSKSGENESVIVVRVAVATPLLDIQRNLAGTTNAQSDFIQEKSLSLLQRAVVIKRRLTVQQPDRYNLILGGTTLRQWYETTFTNTVLNAPIDPRAWEVAPDGR